MDDETCEHEFAFLQTVCFITHEGYNNQYTRIDTFYCKRCLLYKDVRKEEYAREPPSWYKTIS